MYWLYRLFKYLPVSWKNFIFFLINPKFIAGVQAIIVVNKRLLLLQQSYANGWGLPGGMLQRTESFEQAIVREIYEELSVKSNFIKILSVTNFSNKHLINVLCLCQLPKNFKIKIDNYEISYAKFFPLNSLPTDINPAYQSSINFVVANQNQLFK